MSSESDQIITGLWNEDVTADTYGTRGQYQKHAFMQYQMCVEMADRVGARRTATDRFFIAFHTLVVTAAGFVLEQGIQTEYRWLIVFPLLTVLALCYLWWRLNKSSRQLNDVRYRIIGEYEKRLPTSPFWQAEWAGLGEGHDPRRYVATVNLDVGRWVPVAFGFLYTLGAAVFIAS